MNSKMNETKIVFYEEESNKEALNNIIKNIKEKVILIRIDKLKEKKSTFQRFLENELYTIPFLKNLIFNNLVTNKLFNQIKALLKQNNRLREKDLFSKTFDLEIRKVSNYIDADIYERADKESVRLFNQIKELDIVNRLFIFSDINLYETNRLEFVEHYYQTLLTFFAIDKLIKSENPNQIILVPSVNPLNRIIINILAKKYGILLIHIKDERTKKDSLLKRNRLVIERMWYWNIWKLLNLHTNKIDRKKKYKHLNLIFAHYKNHFPALVQVLKSFSDSDKTLSITYTPHKLINYSRELLRKERINNVTISPHTDRKYSEFKKNYVKFKNVLNQILASESFEFVSVDNIKITNLIKLSFLLLHEKITNSFRFLANIHYEFTKIEPDMITLLSGNDAIDVLATRIAKKKQIPSLFFPHALFSIRRDHDAFEQDIVICAGEKDRKYFSSLGTDPDKLIVLGLPLYDKLFEKYANLKNPKDIKQKIRNQFNIEPQKKILALVTTHDENFVREKVFKSVINVSEVNENYFLIVKIHPVEDINYYQKLALKYDAHHLVIIKNVDLHDVLIASDVIIGRSSGAQIEAILLNKDVIDLSYEARSGRQLMDKFNAVISVHKPSDLEGAVKDCLYNTEIKNSLKEGRKQYSEFALYKFDGKASLRIKNQIEKILQ